MRYVFLLAILLAGCSESETDFAKDACHQNLGIWHAADWNGSDAWCDFGGLKD